MKRWRIEDLQLRLQIANLESAILNLNLQIYGN